MWRKLQILPFLKKISHSTCLRLMLCSVSPRCFFLYLDCVASLLFGRMALSCRKPEKGPRRGFVSRKGLVCKLHSLRKFWEKKQKFRLTEVKTASSIFLMGHRLNIIIFKLFQLKVFN